MRDDILSVTAVCGYCRKTYMLLPKIDGNLHLYDTEGREISPTWEGHEVLSGDEKEDCM